MADSELWSLIWRQPQIDPDALARAIEAELMREPDPDYRTRLLIQDSMAALGDNWESEQLATWLATTSVRSRIEAIRQEALGGEGFPSLKRRIVAATSPHLVTQYLTELGERLQAPVTLTIGGSIALVLAGQLVKHTEDIDVVDEVPAELRALPNLLRELEDRFGLALSFFQSHYLPRGWEDRTRLFGLFGRLCVRIVDAKDIFVSKLYSRRAKDLDDLRAVSGQMDLAALTRHLLTYGTDFYADPGFREIARVNWNFLYQQPLPEPSA